MDICLKYLILGHLECLLRVQKETIADSEMIYISILHV